MSRLFVHVEGITEEDFVNTVLAPHLYGFGYTNVDASLLGNAGQRSHRGGIKAWGDVRKRIMDHLNGDPGCRATTMVDYYALPRSGARAWPGRDAAAQLPFSQRAPAVEDALLADVCAELGPNFNPRRFIPYVMMHEFEGLLFSDCARFAQGIYRPELAPAFQRIRDQFDTPEEINDSPLTAPSKRVMDLVPGYQKSLQGVLAVLEIRLDRIREECPHFRSWLERLEGWND